MRAEHAAEETAQAVQKAGGRAVTVKGDVSIEAYAIGEPVGFYRREAEAWLQEIGKPVAR